MYKTHYTYLSFQPIQFGVLERVSGIIISIMYAYSQNIGNSNNLKVCWGTGFWMGDNIEDYQFKSMLKHLLLDGW